MVPFAVQASRGCSSPCLLALALAAEFAPVRPTRADRALDDLAAWLVGARAGDPVDQLDALAELAGAHLEPVVLSSAIDDLLLDRVAAGGAGHPLLLAIACAEAARRAGLAVGIVAGAEGAFVAHRELAEPLLVDPARGGLRDARTLEAPVSWQCCHQVAARILTASASAPSASGRCAGRCAPPSCASRCPSRRPRASAWRPMCGASGRA